jgi:predicted ATP-dependent endonuclease of OLD family
VLVEEPEVYQHPAAIEKTARVLLASARRGVQTVVTTHSLELIDCLVDEADEQARADMALYILRLSDDGELRSSRFAGESMAYARQEAETDLR